MNKFSFGCTSHSAFVPRKSTALYTLNFLEINYDKNFILIEKNKWLENKNNSNERFC